MTTRRDIYRAYRNGFSRGLNNQHYEPRTYRTSAEYLAWYEGWKAGQARRQAREQRSGMVGAAA